MRQAIISIVEDGQSIQAAAEAAGLTRNAVYRGLRDNPEVQTLYAAELRALRTAAKSKAIHCLLKEMDGDNAMGRVGAARAILQEPDAASTQPNGNLPQRPGFSFLIHVDARNEQPLPAQSSAPLLEHSQPDTAGAYPTVTRRPGLFRSGPTDRVD
jgi:hypothetical protein